MLTTSFLVLQCVAARWCWLLSVKPYFIEPHHKYQSAHHFESEAHPFLKKWWHKYVPQRGPMIKEHISPFQQQIWASYLRHAPGVYMRQLTEKRAVVIPLFLLWAVPKYLSAKYEESIKHHWP
jgi:hypothetical protein